MTPEQLRAQLQASRQPSQSDLLSIARVQAVPEQPAESMEWPERYGRRAAGGLVGILDLPQQVGAIGEMGYNLMVSPEHESHDLGMLAAAAELGTRDIVGLADIGERSAYDLTPEELFEYSRRTDPQDIGETAAGVFGGAAVPFVGSLGRGSSLLARIATRTAELVTPVSQASRWSRIPGSIAANVVAGTAVEETIHEGFGEDDPEGYETLYDVAGITSNEPDTQRVTPEGEPIADLRDTFSVIRQEQRRRSLENALDPDRESDWWIAAASLAGAALAGHVTWRQLRRNTLGTPTPAQTHIPTGPEGKPDIESATTAGEAFRARNVDANAGIISQFGRSVPGGATRQMEVDDFTARVNTQARSAGTSRAQEALRTGRLSATRSTHSLEREQEYFARLTPQDADILSKGLLAEDILESRTRGQFGTAKNIPDATLRQWRHLLNLKPELRAAAARYWQMMDDLLSLTVDAGLRSAADAAVIRQNHAHFVPNIRARGPGSQHAASKSWLESTRDRLDDILADSPEFKMESEAFTWAERQPVQDLMNPYSSAEQYAMTLLRFINHNDLRARWVDRALQSADRGIRKSFRKLRKGENKNADDVLMVYRKGGAEYYRFADMGIKRALEFDPMVAENAFNWSRRLFTAGTTGVRAITFPFKALIYDAWAASQFRPKGTRFGLLDELVGRVGGGRLPNVGRGDPTAALTVALGLGRDVGARVALQLSNAIENDLVKRSPMLARVLTRQQMRNLSDRLRDHYIRSPTYLLRSQGAYNAKFLVDATEQRIKQLESLGGRFHVKPSSPVAAPFRYAYQALKFYAELFQNAARVGFVAQNRGRLPDVQLAAEARRIVGDFSRRGSVGFKASENVTLRKPKSTAEGVAQVAQSAAKALPWRTTIEAIPYGNVFIQTIARHAEAIRNGGPQALTGLLLGPAMGMAAGAYLMSRESDEHREYYWTLPGWYRATHAVFPIPGMSPRDALAFPVSPDLAFVGAMLTEGLDAIVGMRGGDVGSLEMKDMIPAVEGMFGVPAPPVVNAAMALNGYEFDFFEGVTPIPRDRLSPGDPGQHNVNSIAPAWLEDAMSAIFGTSTAMYMEMANAVMNADSAPEGASDLFTEAEYQLGRRTPFAGPLFDLPPSYLTTDDKDFVNERTKVADAIIENVNMVRGTGTYVGGISDPQTQNTLFTEGYATPSTNPLIGTYGLAVQGFFSSPYIRELRQKINEVNRELGAAAGTYPKTRRVIRELERLRDQNRQLYAVLQNQIVAFETNIGHTLLELQP